MKKFIHWIYEENLFIKDGIIYDTTDICSKKYRCENAVWVLFVLAFTHRVIIHGYINAPGRGRIKIVDTLKAKICMIGTEESNNESKRTNTYSMICDSNKEFKFKSLTKE